MGISTDEGMLFIPQVEDEIIETDLIYGGTGIPDYALDTPDIDLAEYFVDEPVFDDIPALTRGEKLQKVSDMIRTQGLPAIEQLTGKKAPAPLVAASSAKAGIPGGLVVGILAVLAVLALGVGFKKG